MDANPLWQRYQDLLCDTGELGITLDISRVPFGDEFLPSMEQPMQEAYDAMAGLEAGEIANPDEGRMVGHYWLRNASLAPTDEIGKDIAKTLKSIKQFAKKVHEADIAPQKAKKFTDILQVGIGGSALGPQLVADCLGTSKDKMRVHFLDNTDPDGIARILRDLKSKLKSTLVLVVSKSGGTPETRNGMLETEAAYKKAGLKFGKHAAAITGEASKLDTYAKKHKWLKRFPMWDWVGGRTSVMSAVGLLPAPVTATACLPNVSPAFLYADSVSSMPLRVSGVPPDLETTSTSVLLSLPFKPRSVRAMPSGSVLSRKWTRISSLLVPKQSATSCGPSAEPPMPTSSRSVKRSAPGGLISLL